MPITVKKALIYPNIKKPLINGAVCEVSLKLRSVGITPIINEEYRGVCSEGVLYLPEREALEQADIIVVLGGDGTMLSAARDASGKSTPLLGINLGTLGYMSELEMGELDLLEGLKRPLMLSERMMIDISVIRAGAEIASLSALNEAIVSRGAVASMLRIDLFCDGSKVTSYRADGLIIATPTGSSAYCMSAGGPIIDTKLNAFCACPICSHSLSGARPLVFSPNSVMEIRAESEKGGDIVLTADGRDSLPLIAGDRVKIIKSSRSAKLVKLKKDAFYDALGKKLS